MNKEFSNDDMVIESLYRARMEQWIGDFKEAEKIYDSILNSDDYMAIYLKPSIEEKKKKLAADKVSYQKEMEYFDSLGANYCEDQIKFDFVFQNTKFGSQKRTPPLIQRTKRNINSPVDSVWKYSVIACSKAGEMIRFEIRGYPQVNQKPNIRNLSKQFSEHNIRNVVFTPLEQQIPDSVCVDAQLGDNQMDYYIEIDSWGTIRGEAIISYEKVDVFLQEQNKFLSNLEKVIWKT